MSVYVIIESTKQQREIFLLRFFLFLLLFYFFFYININNKIWYGSLVSVKYTECPNGSDCCPFEVCVSVVVVKFVHCFESSLVYYQFGNERASYFILFVFLVSCDWFFYVALPNGAVGCPAVCDCVISRSYSLTF